MLDLKPHELSTIQLILRKHIPLATVWAFGSRVRGTAKPFSDLDLVVRGTKTLDMSVLGQLKQAFSESDLPFSVDLVDWNTATPEFRRLIEQQHLDLTPDDKQS